MPAARPPGRWRLGLRIAVATALGAALVAGAGRLFALSDELDLARAWEAPSLAHPCGFDGLGRDVLARLLTGTVTSVTAAAGALAFALAVGILFGGLAGWCQGWIDRAIMRLVDLAMAVRELAMAMIIAIAIGPGLFAVVLVLGLAWAPILVRFVRALTLAQCKQTYVRAAVALGASPGHILRVHIFPNIVGPLAVRAAITLGPMIQTEAAVSFLGVGVQDPSSSLGTLIRDGLAGLRSGPHLIGAVTAVVFAIALAGNVVADRLRDAVDPHEGAGRD